MEQSKMVFVMLGVTKLSKIDINHVYILHMNGIDRIVPILIT